MIYIVITNITGKFGIISVLQIWHTYRDWGLGDKLLPSSDIFKSTKNRELFYRK